MSKDNLKEKTTGLNIGPNVAATASIAYTLDSLPVNLAHNVDLNAYKTNLSNVSNIPVPFVNGKTGTAIQYVELAPGTVTTMHQTVSTDHKVCLDGEVELILDSG